MKILLISPPFYKPYSQGQIKADSAPLGLGYLASYLLENVSNIAVRIIDYGVEHYSPDIYCHELKQYQPDIVGITVMTLGYRKAMEIARITKETNNLSLIVAGGPHATIKPEEVTPYCDIVVRGEGEEIFADIVRGKIPIPVTVTCDKRIKNIDNLPMPAHQLFNRKAYAQYPSWGIIGSRGCPFACNFCASPVLWGRELMLRSPKNIVNEIAYLHNIGIRHIVFQDDTLNINPRRTKEICNEIIGRHLHKSITFEAQLRANKECVTPEVFEMLKLANFTQVTFGIETGSNRVMKSINKKLTVDEASRAVSMANKAGIKNVSGFFMVGSWGEGLIDILKTWYFIVTNRISTVLTVCTPLPGTEFDKKLRQHKYLDGDINWEKVTWVTPLSRTDKLPKWAIAILYYMTVLFFHLPANYFRGRRERAQGLMNNITIYLKNLLRGNHVKSAAVR